MPSSSTSITKKKRKRSKTTTSKNTNDDTTCTSKLPTKLLRSLETSDRRASKLRRSELSTDSLPKSQAAQSLLNVQTHLMECRILLQKALTSLPALGQGSAGGGEDEKRVVNKAADRLLLRLLEARNTLYPKQRSATDDSSDDEDDDTKQNYSNLIHNTNTNDSSSSSSSSPSPATIETTLNDEYNALQITWQSTLNRRHTNLRLSSGGAVTSNSTKFKVIDRSFWSQVEGTVRHDAALLPPIHQSTPLPATPTSTTTNDTLPPPLPPRPSTSSPPTPPPLHDDSKLYRHMLQDFLTLSTERHASTTGGGAAEAAATRLRRVMDRQKRKKQAAGEGGGEVDRRASKGRKIRYVVYPKLTHFMFPVERKVVGEGTGVMEEDVLFRSMFGGVVGGGGGKRRKA